VTKFWSKEEEKSFRMWADNVDAGKKIREHFPPVMLIHKLSDSCIGWTEPCRECGTPIKVRFGQAPLEEKFVPCPNSDDSGHGVWASGINIQLN
jgi:hypothetical protein